MGERVWMQVKTVRAHVPAFEELGFDVEEETPGGVVVLVDPEANYGHGGAMGELAKAGVPLLYSHDAKPGCFDAMVGASDGRHFVELLAIDEGVAVVRIDPETGEPRPDDLRDARRYAEIRRAFFALAATQKGVRP